MRYWNVLHFRSHSTRTHADIYVRVSGRNISDAYCMCIEYIYAIFMYYMLYIRKMLSRALGFHDGGAICRYIYIYTHVAVSSSFYFRSLRTYPSTIAYLGVVLSRIRPGRGGFCTRKPRDRHWCQKLSTCCSRRNAVKSHRRNI